MLNQTLLVGRIVEEPELKETSTGKNVANVKIAVPKPYKNEEGIHEAEFIKCSMWNDKAKKASEYYKTGDLVLVTARVHVNEKDNSLELVGEDITFLSKSKKAIEQELSQEDMEEDREL